MPNLLDSGTSVGCYVFAGEVSEDVLPRGVVDVQFNALVDLH